MRVGVNTLFLIPNEVGGSETYVRQLLDAVRRTAPDIELVLFTNRENHESFADYERELIDVAAISRPKRIWAEQTRLPRLAKRTGVDLLFSPGYTAPFFSSVPQVITVHDVQFHALPEDFSLPVRLAHWCLVSGAVRAARKIITLSDFGKRSIVDYFRVPEDKVVAVPHGVTLAFYEPHAFSHPKPYILYVSNTYPHKNAARLGRAFLAIADDVPHDLLVVGQPRGVEPPEHERIKRIHRVDQETLVGLMRSCDLFVFPSLYEGFGLPLLEAMAAGARVVSSRAASLPEVGGDAVTYFDATDEQAMGQAMLAALGEPPETREHYMRAGIERAHMFTWEQSAQHTTAVFQQIVKET